MRKMITASELSNLLEMLYILVVDYTETGEGKAASDTAQEIKINAPKALARWGALLPALDPAIKAALSGRNKLTALVALGQEIKDEFQEFRKFHEFTSEELQVLSSIGQYLRTDSEVALKQLVRLANLTQSTWVAKKMAPKVGSQKDSEAYLRKLVKRMTGRDDNSLSLDESKVARETYPELYKEYLQLRRSYNQVWKDALVSYIRGTKQRLVPYKDVIDYLNANGIQHQLPQGFTGLIDDQGKLYTREGKLIDGVPSAATSPTVQMNKEYGPESPWVFRAIKADGSAPTYFYTSDFKKTQAKIKFEKVADLSNKIPGMRAKWFSRVKKFDMSNEVAVASVILEMLYQFSARVGTPGNSTFGIGTLLVKHFAKQPNGDWVVRYKGKDSVPTKHHIKAADPEQKFLVKALDELIDGKGDKDKVFTMVTPQGKSRIVGPVTANKVFKALSGGGDVTVHKIRTYAGTKLFNDEMEKLMPALQAKKNLTEKDAMVYFIKIAEKVGKLLNHVRRGASGVKTTGITAIANYIDPNAAVSFWRNLDMRPPKMLEKFDV